MSDITGNKKDVGDAGSHSAKEFATFFSDKVDTVRQSTSATPLHRVSSTTTRAAPCSLLAVVTSDDVEKLIGNALNKHCQSGCVLTGEGLGELNPC